MGGAVVALLGTLRDSVAAYCRSAGPSGRAYPARLELASSVATVERLHVTVVALLAPTHQAVGAHRPTGCVGDGTCIALFDLTVGAASVTAHRRTRGLVDAVVTRFPATDESVTTRDCVDARLSRRGTGPVGFDLIARGGATIARGRVAVIATLFDAVDETVPAVGDHFFFHRGSAARRAVGPTPSGALQLR
jgi:hypothetical protein